jgi:hypothetical protein
VEKCQRISVRFVWKTLHVNAVEGQANIIHLIPHTKLYMILVGAQERFLIHMKKTIDRV